MKTFRFFTFLILSLTLASCKDEDAGYTDPRGTDYAGAESCVQCHKDISHTALASAHRKATAPATPENVMGSFSGKNHFVYGNASRISMERDGDSLYQVWTKNGKMAERHSFDIVFGARNAQTAVYWRGSNTYELPVSYYRSVDSWGTSPGFSPSEPHFGRKIIKDCYACHTSNVRNADKRFASGEQSAMTFDLEDIIRKENIVFGIDCERCHGPAKQHADYHKEFPDVKIAKHIKSFKSMSRQQKLDACSICHAGSDGIKIKSRFDFKPGDNLTDFYRPLANAEIDVHGNQHGMLVQSKCFVQSPKLDCTTCHDAHTNAPKESAHYGSICSGCHTKVAHSTATKSSVSQQDLQKKCVECHMPKQDSRAITFYTAFDSPVRSYRLRTHKIAVYPEAKLSK